MRPVPFVGSNVIFGADQPQYQPLPAHRDDGPEGRVTTCWELSNEELDEVLLTGRVWIQTLTFGQPVQPLVAGTESPVFTEHADAAQAPLDLVACEDEGCPECAQGFGVPRVSKSLDEALELAKANPGNTRLVDEARHYVTCECCVRDRHCHASCEECR